MKRIFIIAVLPMMLLSVRYSRADYSLVNVFPNLTFTKMTEMIPSIDGSNRIFVVTQNGVIYVFPNNPNASNPKVFLDLSDRVSQNGSETGLLGMTFHPDYVNNKYFFVDYTTSALPLRTIVARYSVSPTNPDSAIKSSEFIIITVNQPYPNHKGGKIAFGMDHCLFIALGDGGSEGDPLHYGQDRTVLLGKILRINIDSASGGNNYSIPPDNPFYGNTQGFRQEIWTWGMRNPWRFSFDPPTGRCWCADVGQDTWEEIDILHSGGNYGWSVMEGYSCYNPSSACDSTGMTIPIYVYQHLSGNCSITGGYVYRGSDMPELVGKYIYGDYCTGRVWSLSYGSINPPVNTLLVYPAFLISTFGLDENGAIYACRYGTSQAIYKLVGTPIGININSQTVLGYHLEQNYPNPFNPKTKITFSLPVPSKGGVWSVQLIVYDALGREVASLIPPLWGGQEGLQSGSYTVSWDGSNYPSGVYFYKLVLSGAEGQVYTATNKMVLLK